jgi:hypothetical protein
MEIQIREINGLTRTPGYSGGWIRCLGGVSIPCWSITPAVSPVPWSWMRNYPLSKSVCQVRYNYWYEKCHTTYGSMKVYFFLDSIIHIRIFKQVPKYLATGLYRPSGTYSPQAEASTEELKCKTNTISILMHQMRKLEHNYQPGCVYNANKLVILVQKNTPWSEQFETCAMGNTVYSSFINYKQNLPPCGLLKKITSCNCFHLDWAIFNQCK